MLTTGEGLGTKSHLATGNFLDLLNSASTQQGGVRLSDLCHLCILQTCTTYLRGTKGSRKGALPAAVYRHSSLVLAACSFITSKQEHLPQMHHLSFSQDKLRFKQQQTHPARCTAGVCTSSPLHMSYADHAHASGLSALILKGFTRPERLNSPLKPQ